MKRYKTFQAYIIIFCVISYCHSNEAQNIIDASGYGKSSVTESSLGNLRDDEKHDYTQEIIHNFYMNAQQTNLRKEAMATKKNDMLEVIVSKDSQNSKDKKDDKEPTTTIKGYCLIKSDVHIGKQPASLGIECETNIGYITLFANLRPVNKISTLFVDPVYIEFKKYRYLVKSSFVTNEARTSYNIATYVNERKVAEIAYSTTSVGADEVKTASNQYLTAYEQSRYSQQTSIIGGGLTQYPITTFQYQEPDPLLYLAKAGVNLVSSAIKNTADILKKDLPYLYEIKGGSKIFVDMQVLQHGEKVE